LGLARNDARPLDPAYRLSIVAGLVLTFVLGGIEGVIMSSSGGHAVGIPLPDDSGVPIFGWLRTAGDLRVAHFIGIHAQQVLPLFGALAVRLLAARARSAVIAAMLVYSLLAVATFVQAWMGQPLLG
jgi:hypothetical protein